MTRNSCVATATLFYKTKLCKIAVIISVLLISVTDAVCMNNKEITSSEKNLYIYSNRAVNAFFKKIGHPDFSYNDIKISRNSDGTALRFLNERKKIIIVATCEGSVTIINSPGYVSWLNDDNQAVAWFEWSNNKSFVYYKNGMNEARPFNPNSGPDPSGKYFIKETPDIPSRPMSESCYTSIYLVEKPDIPLVKVAMCSTQRIFYQNSKVFLAGGQFYEGSWQQEMYIFQENESNLEQIEKIFIPRPTKPISPFYVEDLSPWGDEMLYLAFRDFPFRSIWYSFNRKTHQFVEVGKVPFGGGKAFYLQCDIIENVLEKQGKEKQGP